VKRGTSRGRPGARLSMQHCAVALCLSALIAGCYVPDRQRLEESVREKIHVGMPIKTAAQTLHGMGIVCDSTVPYKGRISCSRVRERLWPSTCMERVILIVSAQDDIVRNTEVPPIGCTGL
jgi:hypothetical protein